MEILLTPVVNRILSKLIKKVGDGSSPLRASISGGSVLLHNLELNLDRYGKMGSAKIQFWLNSGSRQLECKKC